MSGITLRMNGEGPTVSIDDPDMPLLYVLRDDVGLRGPKFGFGPGQCGACMVLIDGKVSRSCMTRAACATGRAITTLEGLGSTERPSRVLFEVAHATGARMRVAPLTPARVNAAMAQAA